MRLRGDLKHCEGGWRVVLWSHDTRGVPFFFGSRDFSTWDLARAWMLWRLGLSSRRYG